MRNTQIPNRFELIDRTITQYMARHGVALLRVSLGVVFLWFGALKLIPGLSPAEDLVRGSIHFVDPDLILVVVAIWEMVIGIGLLIGRYLRVTLLLLFLQMGGAALPMLIMPDVVWTAFPLGLSLEGQYIIKNMVIIGSAIVIGGTVRGGYIVSEPPNSTVPVGRFPTAYADTP